MKMDIKRINISQIICGNTTHTQTDTHKKKSEYKCGYFDFYYTEWK